MPELPEVETVKWSLKKLMGLSIKGVKIFSTRVIKKPAPKEFADGIIGRKFINLKRRGKYLLFYLSDDKVLLVHLGMTGRFTQSSSSKLPEKHTQVIFYLDDGSELRFNDIRKFGQLWLIPARELSAIVLKKLGVDPLDGNFTYEYLERELGKRCTKIKPLLQNQSFIAGLGNIYIDEILHRAKIHPERFAFSLTSIEIIDLYYTIKEVLKEAIEYRGTTIRDYVDGKGEKGEFQNYLRVYQRAGYPCLYCKETIIKKKVGGRSTYFCPCCQKES